MTYLELVNEVLALLREDSVASVTETDYSILIGKFINRAKYKVENVWEWQRLRNTIRITTSSGTYSYSLTGGGKRFKLLQKLDGSFDVFNDTDDVYLEKAYSTGWMSMMLNYNNQVNSKPGYFDINGYDGSYDPIVDLYPIPDANYTINFNAYIPQADLSKSLYVCISRAW